MDVRECNALLREELAELRADKDRLMSDRDAIAAKLAAYEALDRERAYLELRRVLNENLDWVRGQVAHLGDCDE